MGKIADHIDDGMRRDPTRQAYHQEIEGLLDSSALARASSIPCGSSRTGAVMTSSSPLFERLLGFQALSVQPARAGCSLHRNPQIQL
jgi:hypothetical protein